MRSENYCEKHHVDPEDGFPCPSCQGDENRALRTQVAELEADTGALSLVIEQQDRTLSRHREALDEIVDPPRGMGIRKTIGWLRARAARALNP